MVSIIRPPPPGVEYRVNISAKKLWRRVSSVPLMLLPYKSGSSNNLKKRTKDNFNESLIWQTERVVSQGNAY